MENQTGSLEEIGEFLKQNSLLGGEVTVSIGDEKTKIGAGVFRYLCKIPEEKGIKVEEFSKTGLYGILLDTGLIEEIQPHIYRRTEKAKEAIYKLEICGNLTEGLSARERNADQNSVIGRLDIYQSYEYDPYRI